jgi:hypothetical protein
LASGSAFLRFRHDLSEAQKACTTASAEWAWSDLELNSRMRAWGLSQIPFFRTQRQKKTMTWVESKPAARARESSCSLRPSFRRRTL